MTVSLPDRWITDWDTFERLPYCTRANAGEVLPDPASPLGWTLVFEKGLLPGWLRGLVEFGIYRDGELPSDRPPVVGSFGGYFFINLSHCRIMAVRMGMTVEAFDNAILGSSDVAPPYEPHPDDVDAECSATVGATITRMISATSFPEYVADLDRLLDKRASRPDLTTLGDGELVDYARSFLPELDNGFRIHDFSTLSSAVGPGMLAELTASVGRPEALLELISGLGEVRSASPSWGLWELSRIVNGDAGLTALFDEGVPAVVAALQGTSETRVDPLREPFAGFLRDYGQRGPNEWDIRSVSWEAGLHQPLALVDSLRSSADEHSPDARHARLEATRLATTESIKAALPDDAARQTFDVALGAALRLTALREQTKLVCVTAINEVRMAVRELGRRGVAAGRFAAVEDITMLLESELDDYVAEPDRFAGVIAERLPTYRALFDLEPPFIAGPDLPALSKWQRRAHEDAAAATAGDVLHGVGGSAGTFTGPARVVATLEEAMAIEPGEVLVAPFTDAAWTPLFLVAGAVVVDVGALNSHAVVVSRELGLPSVISIADATSRLRTGMQLTVDGSAGTVTVEGDPV